MTTVTTREIMASHFRLSILDRAEKLTGLTDSKGLNK